MTHDTGNRPPRPPAAVEREWTPTDIGKELLQLRAMLEGAGRLLAAIANDNCGVRLTAVERRLDAIEQKLNGLNGA